jgi:uncharacterized protein
MPIDNDAFARLQSALDRTASWPAPYIFKFIVPQAKLAAVLVIFDGLDARTSLRDSKKGNYVGFTAEMTMSSSEAVVEVYRKAAKIEGIIAL